VSLLDTPLVSSGNDCKAFLTTEYNAITTDGYEADDALGFNQTEDSIICSIDKDLLMIPGHHWNFVKKEHREVSELDGIKAFYRQMLIGDSSDNIFGVKGIGKVKAAKLIDHLETEDEMFKLVVDLYSDPERFIMNADCLWIWRKEKEHFTSRHDIPTRHFTTGSSGEEHKPTWMLLQTTKC